MKIYQRLAGLLSAMATCQRRVDSVASQYVEHWKEQLGRHCGNISTTMEDTAPSGNGLDSVLLDDVDSHENMLIIHFAYHHMNDAGYYVGWSHHRLMVTPDFFHALDLDFTCTIDYQDPAGDHSELYDYLHDTFYDWLMQDEPTVKIPVETTILDDITNSFEPE